MKDIEKKFNWSKCKDMFMAYLKSNWWKLILIFAVVAVDLITKALIVRFDETGEVVKFEQSILGNIVVIFPTSNEGAGWSFLAGHQTLLIVFTFLFLISLSIFDFCYKNNSKLLRISTGLIIAGAVGNLIDRICFNVVRDFIYLKFINFPVFNVADIALTIGVVLLAVFVLFYSGKDKQSKDKMELQNNLNNNGDSNAKDNC